MGPHLTTSLTHSSECYTVQNIFHKQHIIHHETDTDAGTLCCGCCRGTLSTHGAVSRFRRQHVQQWRHNLCQPAVPAVCLQRLVECTCNKWYDADGAREAWMCDVTPCNP